MGRKADWPAQKAKSGPCAETAMRQMPLELRAVLRVAYNEEIGTEEGRKHGESWCRRKEEEMITVPMVLVCFMIFVTTVTKLFWSCFYKRETYGQGYDYEVSAIAFNVLGWIIVIVSIIRIYNHCPKYGC